MEWLDILGKRKRRMRDDQTFLKPKSFKDYYFGTIFRPRRTFDALMEDSQRLRFGFFAISISVVLYMLVYVFLSMRGAAPSSFTLFLAIPKDVYYQYNLFFLTPSMFGCWILAAGVAQILSHAFSGRGSFEDTLSVLGFGIGIATLASLLHDFTDSFLGAIGVLDLNPNRPARTTRSACATTSFPTATRSAPACAATRAASAAIAAP